MEIPFGGKPMKYLTMEEQLASKCHQLFLRVTNVLPCLYQGCPLLLPVCSHSHLLATERIGDVVIVASDLHQQVEKSEPFSVKRRQLVGFPQKDTHFFFKVYTRNPKLYLSEES